MLVIYHTHPRKTPFFANKEVLTKNSRRVDESRNKKTISENVGELDASKKNITSKKPAAKSEGLFELVLQLQSEHHHLQGLVCALTIVVNELRETPSVSRLPAVSAAEALNEAMHKVQAQHLATLELLESSRFEMV